MIFDLFGIDSLPDHIAQAATFLVTQYIKALAFDAEDDRAKYIVLDEVAQLIKWPELASLVDELYSTARKHHTSVWTVTQQYAAYTQSPLAGTIRLNSTTQILLSHASDTEARARIGRDFALDAREQVLFESLTTVKGEYSEALLRTQVLEGDDKRQIAAKLRIRLSPFDYEISTSDAGDRARQRRWMNANPGSPIWAVLEKMAYGKTKELTR